MRGNTDGRELVLLAALLLFVAGLCLQPVTESDLFFRLKMGQEILARRGLPGRNLFSFTAPDYPDLDLAWAFEVAVALLYQAGGFPAVVVGKTIGIVAIFAGAFWLCRIQGAGPVAATIVLAGAALVMRDRLVERPHVVSFAGEVVVLAAITGLGRPWSGRALFGFSLAMVLWANAHAGSFAGLLLVGLAAAGFLPTDRGRARRGLVLGAIVVGAACVTPEGPVGIGRYLVLHIRLPALHPIDEFRGATWRSDAPFFVWLIALAAIVGAGWIASRRRVVTFSGGIVNDPGKEIAPAPSLPDLLPALGITILGLWSVRFSADASLCTAPLMAVQVSAWAGSAGRGLIRTWLARAATPVAVVSLLLATVWPRLGVARAGGPALDVEVDTSVMPLRALRFVEDHGLRERMYNDFEFGSYLLFQGYPRYRVFVDPRLPAYPDDMHRLLGSFDMDRATWDEAMTRYGVETALLGDAGINRRVAWWDPESWALVHRANDARVFVRRHERWRALILAYEIPATFSFSVENGAATLPLEIKPPASPVPDCEWQRRLGDLVFELDHGSPARARSYHEHALEVPACLAPKDEAHLAAWLGAIELGTGQWERAAVHLGRALVLGPGDTRTRANRATVFERLGRRAEAAADWGRVASEARGTPAGEAAAARAQGLAR